MCKVFHARWKQYVLTPWCRVLLEKQTGLQLVKKFPAFHGTRRFITAFTSVRQLSLSWASPIQSIYPHPTSWRSILILSAHLCLGHPSGLLPSGFPSMTLYTPLSSPIRATWPDKNKTTVPKIQTSEKGLFCLYFYLVIWHTFMTNDRIFYEKQWRSSCTQTQGGKEHLSHSTKKEG